MKKTVRGMAILLSVVLLFSFTACGKSTIVGDWKDGTSSYEFLFKEDGTGTMTLGTTGMVSITYTTSGDKLTIYLNILGQQQSQEYTYSLKKDTLVLTKDGDSVTYTKQ